MTTRKNNRVSQTEENNHESSTIKRIARAGRTQIRRRRNLRRQSATDRKTTHIQKGKKIQMKKKHGLDFTGSTLDVRCGTVKGVLYIEKMEIGVTEKCIKASNGTWFTLPEFEAKGGCRSWKSWKRSIRSDGVTLEKLINEGHLCNPPFHRKKKKETLSGPVHQSPQLQSSAASGRRIDILSRPHTMLRQIKNISLSCRTMQKKLRDMEDNLSCLERELEHLDQTLSMPDVWKQMIDMNSHQKVLETSVGKVLETLGLEKA